MLRIDSKNMNFNGTSIIDETAIASFNASVNETDNNSYVNISIQNLSSVRTNINTFEADLNAFIREITGISVAEENDNIE